MVCQKCEKKLSKSHVNSLNTNSKVAYNLESSSRQIIKNKILVKSQRNLNTLCELCKGRVESSNKYCLTCAYTKGICEICGVRLTDTGSFKFTDVDIKDSKRQKKMMQKTQNLSKELLKEKGFDHDDYINKSSDSNTKMIKRKRLRKLERISTNEKNAEISKEKLGLIIEEDSIDEYDEVINV